MLQALIFDVDGTLADTERWGHRVAFNRAFADAGLDWIWDEALYGELLEVAGGKERLRHYIRTFHPAVPEDPQGEDALINHLHTRKNWRYTQLLRCGGIPARPGVLRLLEEALEEGLRLAIATTTTLKNVETLLTTLIGPHAPGWFDVIAAGDVVTHKKPAPDIYQYVLAKLGLLPENCLAFEDSQLGLRSSLAAGIPTWITVNDYTRRQDFSGALAVTDHLGDPDRPSTYLGVQAPQSASTLIDVKALRQLHAQRTSE
jgi:HAD superfamily hydrolase (TIGR01509 family)